MTEQVSVEIGIINQTPGTFDLIFDRLLSGPLKETLTTKYLVYDVGHCRISAGVAMHLSHYSVFFKSGSDSVSQVNVPRVDAYRAVDTFDDMARTTKLYRVTNDILLGTEILFCYFIGMNPDKADIFPVPHKPGCYMVSLTKIRGEKFRY